MADQSLEILIKTIADATGIQMTTEQISKLKEAMADTGVAAGKLGGDMKEAGESYLPESLQNLPKAQDEAGEAIERTGGHAVNARMKHMAFHHAVSELNKAVPGLGSTLMMLERGMDGAGNSAEGAAGKFAMALDTLGPLLIAMLTIQAITEYWGIYENKLKSIGETQARIAKEFGDELKGMLKAQQEFDAAMNPKKTEADVAKKGLEDKQQSIKDEAELKKTGAKQSEQDELAAIEKKREANKKAEADFELEARKRGVSSEAIASRKGEFESIDKGLAGQEKAVKTNYESVVSGIELAMKVALEGAAEQASVAMKAKAKEIAAAAHAEATGTAEQAAFGDIQGTSKRGKFNQATLDNALWEQHYDDIASLGFTILGRMAKTALTGEGAESSEVTAARKAQNDTATAGEAAVRPIAKDVGDKFKSASELETSGQGVDVEADKARHETLMAEALKLMPSHKNQSSQILEIVNQLLSVHETSKYDVQLLKQRVDALGK